MSDAYNRGVLAGMQIAANFIGGRVPDAEATEVDDERFWYPHCASLIEREIRTRRERRIAVVDPEKSK